MTNKFFSSKLAGFLRPVRWWLVLPALYSSFLAAQGESNFLDHSIRENAVAPDLTEIMAVISSLPEGNWKRVNLNNYSDVWTPPDLRPAGAHDPSRIISSWGSFAWDTNRAELWIYGGGHANYSGNDVYRWRASTRMWERASLPSQWMKDVLGNYIAVDGADAAPVSAHTYDNNIFLPIVDRLLVLGGAGYNSGGPYRRQTTATTSRTTGPYFFDPNRADPSKVGGTTGSHVQTAGYYPEVVGGEMWQNRDHTINLSGAPLPANHVDGCTAYAAEEGRDAVYVAAYVGGTARNLYRYVVADASNPTMDTWERIGGYWGSAGGSTSCAFDSAQRIFFRTGGDARFYYWDTATPGANNYEVLVDLMDPAAELLPLLKQNSITLKRCGLDFNPVLRNYLLWCGDGRVWAITPPPTPSPSGWAVSLEPAPTGSSLVPDGKDFGSGILGKWKYVSNLGVFVGLGNKFSGDVWVYKPGSRHSDSIVFFVIHGKWKIVNIHRLMTGACKPLWNQVYSRLLGDRNECNERSQPDVLLEGSRRPTQTQQWDAA